MNRFGIKKRLAKAFEILGITRFYEKQLKRKYGNNYIRIVNYHNTEAEDVANFMKQMEWFRKKYTNVSYEEFKQFLLGQMDFNDKPGIMLTFDDGLIGNYYNAYPVLKKYGFTGYFMCSSELVGTRGYMSFEQLRELVDQGHVVGDHTATHHRMHESDTEEILQKEIVSSKEALSKGCGCEIDIFCWCGGEEEHYTRKAHELITKTGYKYSFLTNSEPVIHNTNPFAIQRSNIEASWPLSLVRLQLCGFMDAHFKNKRLRVNQKLIIE